MSDQTYDTIKIIALLILPLGTFVSTILSIWQVPYSEQVMASFAALDVLAGVVVSIAKARYDSRRDGDGKY